MVALLLAVMSGLALADKYTDTTDVFKKSEAVQPSKASYHKGMVVFVHAKGGLMYEATIGGQKFKFKPKE
jgi:hypothetical protein